MLTPSTLDPRSRLAASWLTALLSAAFVLAWSSGFVGSRLGAGTADPLSFLSWRVLLLSPVAGAILWVTSRRRGAAVRRSAFLGQNIVVGLLTQVVYTWGTVAAVQYGVSVGVAAVITALQPLMSQAFVALALRERVRVQEWVGLCVGLVGVVVTVGTGFSGGTAPPWAYLLPLIGMLALVTATLIEARRPSPLPVVEQLSIQVLVGALVFVPTALATGQLVGPHLEQGVFWATVSWYMIFSIVGGYTLYWTVLRRTSAARVGTLIYLTPPTAALWAWWMFGDSPTPAALLGFAITASGVLIAVSTQRKGPPAS